MTVQDVISPHTAAEHISVTLVAEGLDFAWERRPVLRALDLVLPAGSITSVRGANGSGKTTLLRLLAGGLEPDGGRVRLGALEATADRRAYARRIGIASAGDRGLYARLDVRANLELACGLALVHRSRTRELVARALERFALTELARRRGDRLSLGQRQRLRLAVAFVHEPAVVLLDEPTASLDGEGADLLACALSDLARRGASALWVAPVGTPVGLPADRAHRLVAGCLEAGV